MGVLILPWSSIFQFNSILLSQRGEILSSNLSFTLEDNASDWLTGLWLMWLHGLPQPDSAIHQVHMFVTIFTVLGTMFALTTVVQYYQVVCFGHVRLWDWWKSCLCGLCMTMVSMPDYTSKALHHTRILLALVTGHTMQNLSCLHCSPLINKDSLGSSEI